MCVCMWGGGAQVPHGGIRTSTARGRLGCRRRSSAEMWSEIRAGSTDQSTWCVDCQPLPRRSAIGQRSPPPNLGRRRQGGASTQQRGPANARRGRGGGGEACMPPARHRYGGGQAHIE